MNSPTKRSPLILAAALIITLINSNLQSLAFEQPIAGSEEKPNIVVILADDLGYGDVSPNNPKSTIKTPSFEMLAKQGVNFIDAHSGSGVCTPTRYGLVCGRYCWRTRLKRGVLGGYSKPLINLDQQTIGGVLQSSGYYTKCIGKWHLGLGWQWKEGEPDNINFFGIAGGKQMVDYGQPITDGPLQHGFHESFIIPASLDMSPYVFVQNDRVEKRPNRVIPGSKFAAFYRKGEISPDFTHVDCLGRLTDEACEFISKQSKLDHPFFLYFPMPAPHKPVIPREDFHGTSGLGPYGDFVAQVDAEIGRVIKAIDDAGISDNTLLIVTSDNGSFMHRLKAGDKDHVDDQSVQGFRIKNHMANGQLRGTKADVWEAGHRVPFFVRWPNKISGGKKLTKTICLTDILATACDASGATFDAKKSPDSFSFLTAATTAGKKFADRPMVINHSSSGMFAIRDGNWKLVLGNGSGGRQKPKGKAFAKPYALFDLSKDIGETDNLFDQNPEQAAKMIEAFKMIAPEDAKQIQ